jgi:hypothetical protein
MRKRIIAQVRKEAASPDQDWLNMEGAWRWKSHQRMPLIQLSPRYCPVGLRDGVRQGPDSRRSGFSSTIHNGCGESG